MLPLYGWTTNVVYAMLWSRDRQIEPPCRLKLGGGNMVRRCFVTGSGSGATGLFIGDLCLASGLS